MNIFYEIHPRRWGNRDNISYEISYINDSNLLGPKQRGSTKSFLKRVYRELGLCVVCNIYNANAQ